MVNEDGAIARDYSNMNGSDHDNNNDTDNESDKYENN